MVNAPAVASRTRKGGFVAAAIALSFAVAALDLLAHGAPVVPVLHILPVALAAAVATRASIIRVAALSTVLIVVAVDGTAPADLPLAIVNRGVAALVLWIVALSWWRFRMDRRREIDLRNQVERHEAELVRSMEELHEARLDQGDRTRALISITEDLRHDRERLARLAAIVESSEDAIIGKNLDGRILSWNHGATLLYGYTAEEMIGAPVALLAPPENVDEIADILYRVGRGEALEGFETIRLRKDGTCVHVSLTISPIRDGNGRVVGASTIARDITERVHAQRRLKATLDELARSNAELAQFAYIASHDLQEPVRMVSSYLDLIRRRYGGKLDADADEFIEFAVDGARRMRGMIEDLLTYSRVGTGGKPFKPVEMDDVLEQVLDNLKVAIEESGASIELDGLPTVEGDEGQLMQLFQNLIGNAIKFTGDDPPRVRVDAARKGAEWEFRVHDNGIGIQPEHQERIFQIFQRLHSREEYPGSGIGLALCRKIVERHGGRIRVDSEPGRGTVFTFSIPASRREKVSHPTRSSSRQGVAR